MLTPNTITDRAALLVELEPVRRAGIAYDREEHTVGICGVGCVVRDANGRVASISVPLPAQRFYRHEHELAPILISTCAEITRALTSV